MKLAPAVTYLRVSTIEQARRNHEPEGYSIPAQREACQRRASQLEAEVVTEFVDRGASARSANRPELKKLLAYIDEHQVAYVIVHKIDRLARNLADHVEITLAIRTAGADLISVVENIDDTPLGEYMQTIFAANAQLYSANLSAEAKKGLHKKAQLGGTPGLAPIGYLNVRKVIEGQEVRTIDIDRERAPHVRWAFAAYAAGIYTLDTLHAALEKRGLTTRPTRRRPARPLSRSRIAKMLASKYYIGVVTYGGVEQPGRHTPLIDAETFNRVQGVISAHANSGEKDRKHEHYLKGTLYCARCGHRLTFVRAKGNGGIYAYFACVGRIIGNGCRQRYVSVDSVEDAVVEYWLSVELQPKQADKVRESLKKAVAGMRDLSTRELRRQRIRLEKLKLERQKLLQAFYADAIAIDHLKSEQDRIAREVAAAEQQLALANENLGDVETVISQAIDLAANCGAGYAASDGTTRRQWNQAFFDKLLVRDGDIASDERAAPFDDLTDPALPSRIVKEKAPPPKRFSDGLGSKERLLVGATGFEPAT